MATYVTLINFTDQGIRNVKDTANRASTYKKLATQLGCTLKEIYWTQGQVGRAAGPYSCRSTGVSPVARVVTRAQTAVRSMHLSLRITHHVP